MDDIAPEFAPTTAERIARNDALFREANERIKEKAEEYAIDGAVPFICECADPTCREVVRLHLEDYRRVRAHSRHFFNIPGHQAVAGDAVEVVGEGDGYVLVEKVGRAGEVAEALDDRPKDEQI